MVLADKQLFEKVLPFKNNQRRKKNCHDNVHPEGPKGVSKSKIDWAECGGCREKRPKNWVIGVICHIQQNMREVANKN